MNGATFRLASPGIGARLSAFVGVIVCAVALGGAAGCAVQVQGRMPFELEGAGSPSRSFETALPAVLGVADVVYKPSDTYTWKSLGSEYMGPAAVSKTARKNEAALPLIITDFVRKSGLFKNVVRVPPMRDIDLVLEVEVTECGVDVTSKASTSIIQTDTQLSTAASMAVTARIRTPDGKEVDSINLKATQQPRAFSGGFAGLDVAGAQNSGMDMTDKSSRYGQEVFHELMERLVGELESRQTRLLASLPPPKQPAEPAPAVAASQAPSPVGQRWAVVIGISNYKNATQRLPSLRFAHSDAAAFAEFLKSEAGGGFAADHVRLLTNEQATVTEVRAALFEFLRHTVKEDLVVIYFSGHGIPDPDKPSNLYLVAHDSNPARIAATGVPMWDIETALVRTIAAERVLVLVDACHSAGAAEGVRGIGVSGQFKTYFDELARTKPGRLVFTSCEGYEVSREAEKWGGGHGVFTWALLDGLRGKADLDKDGFVRLGEVLDYVDITVRRETANEQHPARAGTQFDRSLPMGVVK
jgi:hypothetical protein